MKVIKFISVSVLFLLLLNFSLKSQIIGGKVVQIHDRKSIPYTTLAIEGTTLGIVTDFDGNFVFEFSGEHLSGNIVVTCIGYKDRIIEIRRISGRLDIVIELEPTNIEIEEVIVEQKSLLPYSIVKKAVDAAYLNYISKPYNYELYYKNIDETSAGETFEREAIVLLHDKKGYKPTSVYKTFKEINYRFLHSKRNFEINNLNFGNTNIDDLLEFDIARHKANILDKRRIYDFDIVIKDEIIYNGDSVWVLAYQCNKPGLIHTGDFSAKTYSGEIFIKKKDYAVLYNNTAVTTKNPSSLSRNLYVDKNANTLKINNASYNFEVYYKKGESSYVLDKITYKISYTYKKSDKGQVINSESEFKVLNVNIESPQELDIRDYFEDVEFDAGFWAEFNK